VVLTVLAFVGLCPTPQLKFLVGCVLMLGAHTHVEGMVFTHVSLLMCVYYEHGTQKGLSKLATGVRC
jgi:hypothetical protein